MYDVCTHPLLLFQKSRFPEFPPASLWSSPITNLTFFHRNINTYVWDVRGESKRLKPGALPYYYEVLNGLGVNLLTFFKISQTSSLFWHFVVDPSQPVSTQSSKNHQWNTNYQPTTYMHTFTIIRVHLTLLGTTDLSLAATFTHTHRSHSYA